MPMEIDSLTIVPRAALEQTGVGPVTRERLQRLQDYDLSHVTVELVDKGPKWSAEQIWPLRLHFGRADLELARKLEREFKRFVALTLIHPGQIYAPSGPVDMYWHFFVLHTRDYERFCEAIWGGAVDHGKLPSDRADDADFLAPDVDDAAKGAKNPDVEATLRDIAPPDVYDALPEETKERLRRLAEWDLSFFTERLVDRGRMFSPEQAYPIRAHFGRCDLEVTKKLEREFRRFVALTLIEPGHVFAPSGLVDMYWHFMILHTHEYREFCERIWGSFQHHPRGSQ